jgi:MFS family permease
MKLQNLKIYYLLIFTNNLWFITANWLNFWLKYMTFKEVGFIDALAFLVGVMLEFPSGVISDKLGRKQTLLISQSLQLLGSLIITLSSNFFEIGFGFVIFQIGVAFYSGTVEAFGYESSLIINNDYTKVLLKSGYISNLAYLGSLVIGGYLYLLNNNLPNILFSINFFIGILLCYFIKDYTVVREETVNFKSFNVNFNLKIVISYIFLMSLAFSFDYGFLKLVILEKFSSLTNNFWFIFLGTLSSLYLNSYLVPKVKNFNISIYISLVLIVVSCILTFFSFIPLFLVLSFLAIFIYQISLKYINEKVEDFQRASVISLFNICYKLPYVLFALILGYNLT